MMTWALCILIPTLNWAAAAKVSPPDYRTPGYWSLPTSSSALFGRLSVRIKVGEAGTGEFSAWMSSKGAIPLEGRGIDKVAWVMPVDRLEEMDQVARGAGFQVEHAPPAAPCAAEDTARAKADLNSLTKEFVLVEDNRTRLGSVLYLAAAYVTALHDIVDSCTARREAVVYLETDSAAPDWYISGEVIHGGPRVDLSNRWVRIPPASGEPLDDYLLWGELAPLSLCSGKATLLTLTEVRDAAAFQTATARLISPYGDRPLVHRCTDRASLVGEDGDGATTTGFRVLDTAIPAIRDKLASFGPVKQEDVLVEAEYAPQRREAHLWYASLKSELDDAGDLLRQAPHIDALVRDEVARLPLYFASSEDSEGRRLVFVRLRR
ncbi:MAG: hypothetical protein HY926_09830 [Elusimicrobia bacterium]|nr:hypothetical protein [Elusimicrobiota bacterium]